jgi:hypothetical protein
MFGIHPYAEFLQITFVFRSSIRPLNVAIAVS